MPNTMSLRGHTSRPNAVSARGRALRAIPAQSLVPARRFQQNVGRSVAAASGASTAPAPVDDKNVPEAHRGLHGFLYGEGGAEEHDAVGSYAVRKDEDEGGLVMPVSAYLESRDGDKPLGTYLVYDSEGRPQYVGYSRNMVLAIKGHLARVGPQRCASVRAMVFANKAMASRTNMERGVAAWVEELLGGVLPPGNADPAQRIEWEGGAAAASVEEEAAGGGGNGGRGVVGVGPASLGTEHMSAAELAAYEEKRLKMRKAMGEKVALPPGVGADDAHGHSHSHDHEEEDSPEERRRKLMKAMDRGDWSAVVSQQTQEATGAGEGAAASSSSSSAAPHPPAMSSASGGSVDGSTSIDMEEPAPLRTIDSPFRAGGQGDAHVGSLSTVASVRSMDDMLRLTVRGVEACLDEVRPYLMADGGDVEVVDVQDGIVYLRLQGACSSCPSQTSTMKGGIERIIRATFGDQVRDILQLEATDPGANPQRVDAALNMLRGAIHNWGGAVEVVSVENHVAVLRYKGPPAIGKGVQGAIKEQFKELREVQLVPFEEEGAAAGDSKAGAQGKAGSA